MGYRSEAKKLDNGIDFLERVHYRLRERLESIIPDEIDIGLDDSVRYEIYGDISRLSESISIVQSCGIELVKERGRLRGDGRDHIVKNFKKTMTYANFADSNCRFF